ncbi:hypothetical protein BCR33DRAFT_849791 [Rhizoclosmatium globosum]|uniref:Nucleotidyl transferase domain-containing protein n=1 Tax=Rhizoclosmatium globosum TaxID=329046 RepID=A0A1Y2CEN3_9FUNG|nr:hypothetical protein BCR33DRAFT_849791 [Rhizoclosmatium globosum]|eukprot:ORY45520.1 hypothetical protein BCR33DRAFT_849791 [Rhizoclosmatium globosum]
MSKVAVLFLAAGYGTRLQRDIQADTSGRFEAQKGVAKALLPLLGVPLISHWLKQLDQLFPLRIHHPLNHTTSKSTTAAMHCSFLSRQTRYRHPQNGIIETDPHDSFGTAVRVTSLIEKPHPTTTKSRLACPCFYYFSHEALGKIHEFVDGSIARGEGLEARDAAGRLIEWLVLRYPVYTTGISGRLDIGGLDSYIEAEEYLKST